MTSVRDRSVILHSCLSHRGFVYFQPIVFSVLQEKCVSSRLIIRRSGGGDPFSSVWSFSLERLRKTPPTLLEPLLSSLAVTLRRSSPPPQKGRGCLSRPVQPGPAWPLRLRRRPTRLTLGSSTSPSRGFDRASLSNGRKGELQDSAKCKHLFVPRWIFQDLLATASAGVRQELSRFHKWTGSPAHTLHARHTFVTYVHWLGQRGLHLSQPLQYEERSDGDSNSCILR